MESFCPACQLPLSVLRRIIEFLGGKVRAEDEDHWKWLHYDSPFAKFMTGKLVSVIGKDEPDVESSDSQLLITCEGGTRFLMELPALLLNSNRLRSSTDAKKAAIGLGSKHQHERQLEAHRHHHHHHHDEELFGDEFDLMEAAGFHHFHAHAHNHDHDHDSHSHSHDHDHDHHNHNHHDDLDVDESLLDLHLSGMRHHSHTHTHTHTHTHGSGAFPHDHIHANGDRHLLSSRSREHRFRPHDQLDNGRRSKALQLTETAKQISKNLALLSDAEKRKTLRIERDEFFRLIRQQVVCVGCCSRLEIFFTEYAASTSAHGKPLPIDGVIVTSDHALTVEDRVLSNCDLTAALIEQHRSGRDFTGLAEASAASRGNRRKLQQRCVLHSKKPVPAGLWRDAWKSLLDDYWDDVADAAELDETTFYYNLQAHLKRRKFCGACKENVMCAYDDLRDGTHDVDDEDDVPNCLDLFSSIKFCEETGKILIPVQVDCLAQLLARADAESALQSKHASTQEAAQEELLVCLGLALKERLQALWRQNKSDEMVRCRLLQLAGCCFLEHLQDAIESKQGGLVEQLLREETIADEARKERLKKKREKKKAKKKKAKDPTGTGRDMLFESTETSHKSTQGSGRGGHDESDEEEDDDDPSSESSPQSASVVHSATTKGTVKNGQASAGGGGHTHDPKPDRPAGETVKPHSVTGPKPNGKTESKSQAVGGKSTANTGQHGVKDKDKQHASNTNSNTKGAKKTESAITSSSSSKQHTSTVLRDQTLSNGHHNGFLRGGIGISLSSAFELDEDELDDEEDGDFLISEEEIKNWHANKDAIEQSRQQQRALLKQRFAQFVERKNVTSKDNVPDVSVAM